MGIYKSRLTYQPAHICIAGERPQGQHAHSTKGAPGALIELAALELCISFSLRWTAVLSFQAEAEAPDLHNFTKGYSEIERYPKSKSLL